MIIGLLVLLGVALSIIDNKSKYIFFYLILVMWIISSFTYGNADENIYMSRYLNLEAWKNDTELLYYLLIKYSNVIKLSYVQFKMLTSAMQLLLISVTVLKCSKKPNLVMIFYFIFPFMINVTQMRNALATSIFIFGAQFLIDELQNGYQVEKKFLSHNEIKYIMCIVVAAFIHTSAIFWILLLIPLKFNEKIVLIWTAFIPILVVFFNSTSLNKIFLVFGTSSRMSAYTTEAYSKTRALLMNGALFRTILFAVIVYLLIFYLKTIKSVNRDVLFLLKLNTILLTVIPIIYFYTPEMYRVQVDTSILIYIIGFNQLLGIDSHKFNHLIIPVKNCVILFMLLLLSGLSLYFLIIRRNFEAVIYPIFNYNLFVDALVN